MTSTELLLWARGSPGGVMQKIGVGVHQLTGWRVQHPIACAAVDPSLAIWPARLCASCITVLALRHDLHSQLVPYAATQRVKACSADWQCAGQEVRCSTP